VVLDLLLAGYIGKQTVILRLEISNQHRFAYAVLAAEELVSVSNTVKFRYDDGTTFLNWVVGESVDNAVWISLFLVLTISINMFPVKVCIPACLNDDNSSISRELTNLQVFGELEYVFGSIKLMFITMIIVMMLILDVMKRKFQLLYLPHLWLTSLSEPARADAYYTQTLGSKCKQPSL
jgi:yeast amino acid transporter